MSQPLVIIACIKLSKFCLRNVPSIWGKSGARRYL
jgi:hypothetical protein